MAIAFQKQAKSDVEPLRGLNQTDQNGPTGISPNSSQKEICPLCPRAVCAGIDLPYL
jgi:hypothetical protein